MAPSHRQIVEQKKKSQTQRKTASDSISRRLKMSPNEPMGSEVRVAVILVGGLTGRRWEGTFGELVTFFSLAQMLMAWMFTY